MPRARWTPSATRPGLEAAAPRKGKGNAKSDAAMDAARIALTNAIESGPIFVGQSKRDTAWEWRVLHMDDGFIASIGWAVNKLNGDNNGNLIHAKTPGDARFAVQTAAIEAGGLELAKRIEFGPI